MEQINDNRKVHPLYVLAWLFLNSRLHVLINLQSIHVLINLQSMPRHQRVFVQPLSERRDVYGWDQLVLLRMPGWLYRKQL